MNGDIGGGCVGEVLVLAFFGGDAMIDGGGWWKLFCWGDMIVCEYGISGLDECGRGLWKLVASGDVTVCVGENGPGAEE
jgi:hypothetical protein